MVTNTKDFKKIVTNAKDQVGCREGRHEWESILFLKKNIFIDYAITVVPFPPPTPLHPAHAPPSHIPPL